MILNFGIAPENLPHLFPAFRKSFGKSLAILFLIGGVSACTPQIVGHKKASAPARIAPTPTATPERSPPPAPSGSTAALNPHFDEGTLTNRLSVHAVWTAPDSPLVTSTEIVFFSDDHCGTPSEASLPLKNPSISETEQSFSTEGTYTFRILSVLSSGEESNSDCSVPLVIDTTPPALPASIGFSNGSFSNAASVTALWSKSTSEDLLSQSVQFFSDATCHAPLGPSLALGALEQEIRFIGSDNQILSYELTLTDQAMNTVSACSSSTHVLLTPPVLASATILGISLTRTSPLTLQYGSINRDFVSYCILTNDTDPSHCDWTAGTSLPASRSPDRQGTIAYTFLLKDAVGNQSAPVTSNLITYDSISPAAPTGITLSSEISPIDRVPKPGFLVSGVEPGSSVSIYANNSCTILIGSGVASGSGSTLTVVPSGNLSEGSGSYYAAQTDPAGNTSPCSSLGVAYTLDLTPPPAPQFLSWRSGSTSNSISLIADWTPASSDLQSQTVTLYSSLSCYGAEKESASISAQAATHVFTGENSRTYSFKVTSVDSAGNTTNACSGPVTVHTADPYLTSFAITERSPGTAQTLHFTSGSASTSFSSWCLLANSTNSSDCASWTQGTSLPSSYPLPSDGSYEFTLFLKDVAGNIGSPTTTGTYLLDTVKPALASASFSSQCASCRGLNLTLGAISGDPKTYCILETRTAVTPSSSGCSFLNLLPGGTLPATAVTSLMAPNSGSVYLTFYLKDEAGNISIPVTAGPVTLDLTPPNTPSSITLTNPSSSPGNISRPSFLVSGVASGDLVVLFTNSSCSGNSLGSATASGSSVTIGVDSNGALTDGSYSFFAKSRDQSGNVSNCSSASASYRFDGTPPAAATNLHYGPWTNLNQSPPVIAMDWSASTSGDLSAQTLQVFYNGSCAGTPDETIAAAVPFPYAGMMIGGQSGKTESFNIRSQDQVGNFSISECSPPIQVGVIQGTITQELVIPETESGAISSLLDHPGWHLHFSIPVSVDQMTEELLLSGDPFENALSSSTSTASGIRYRVRAREPDQGMAQDFDITVVAVTRPGRIAPWLDATALNSERGTFSPLALDAFTYEGAPVQTLHERPHRYSCDCSDPNRNQNLAQDKFTDRIAGSSILPFEICSREDLQSIQNLIDQAKSAQTSNPSFVQCVDLDLQGLTMAPIGSIDHPFQGTYDGNGFSILNLTLHPDSGTLGLFASLDHATIENLSILGADIGNSLDGVSCGILAGVSIDSTVEKVAAEGNVHCRNGNAGGLIGSVEHELSLFKEVSSAGTVTGDGASQVGGLFGNACNVNLMQSFATALVRSENLDAGGLIGHLQCDQNTIERSYATGSVRAGSMAGGLIGRSEEQVRVRDSAYLNGGIHGDHDAGGIIGWTNGGELTLTHVYAAPISLDPWIDQGPISAYLPNSVSGGLPHYHPILGNYDDLAAGSESLHFTGVAHWSSGANLNGDAPQYHGGSYPESWPLTDTAAFQSMSFDQLSDSALLSGLGFDFHSAWESTITPGIPLPRIEDHVPVLVTLPHRIACEESCNPGVESFVDAGPGSDGSPEHPYLVCSERQLQGLSEVDWRSRIGANFVQCRDLDLKGMRPSPIGSINAPFQGVYDGNGYRISNLEIRDSSHQNLGLFGFLKNARLQNIILERARIIGDSVAGVLFGYSDSSTLENVHVQNGSIVQVQSAMAGLIGGKALNTSLSLSSADGLVESAEAAGGLVGFAHALRLDRSFATAQVYASHTGAGGLIGIWQDAGSLTRSYANGPVVSDRGRAGGLIGDARAVNETLVIRNSAYLNHSVTSGGGPAGGLIGNGDRGLDLGNSYSAAISVSGVNPDSTHPIIGNYRDFAKLNSYPSFSSVEYWSEGANPEGSLPHYPKSLYASLSEAPFSAESFRILSNESMMSQKGFDFDTTWAMDPGLRLPLPLIDFTTPDAPAPQNVLHPFACACDPDYPGGSPMADGSSLRPYQVCSPNHLGFLARNYSKAFVQCQDLDLRNRAHRPIPIFKGHYDGNGYQIRNLTLSDVTPNAVREDQINLGFFGILSAGARVENMTLTSVTLPDPSKLGAKPGYTAGSLAGLAREESQIVNSRIHLASFRSPNGEAGGVVGVARDTTFQNIEVSGAEVTGGSNLGGLVGTCENCTMKAILTKVDVLGTDKVGGIAGALGKQSLLLDSVASGRVHGDHATGGLVGSVDDGWAQIERCSFRGDSVRGITLVGGLIGTLSGSLTLKDSLSLAREITGESSSNPILGNYDTANSEGRLSSIVNVRFWEGGTDPNGNSTVLPNDYAFGSDSGISGSDYSSLPLSDLNTTLSSIGSKGLPGSNLLPYLPPIPTPSPVAARPTSHDYFIPRTLHTQTPITDSRGKTQLLVVGGYNDGSPDRILNSAQIYDPETKTWRDTTPLNSPRYAHGAALLPDGSVMIYGGITPEGSPTQTEIYSPLDESWTEGPPMIGMHGFGFSEAVIPERGILVAGGAGDQGITDSIEVFSFVSRSWSDFGTLREPRVHAASSVLPGDRMLIAGGETSDGKSVSVLGSSELIDLPSSGGSGPVSKLNQARTHGSAIHWTPADGSRLGPMTFLFGGYDDQYNALSSIEFLQDDQIRMSENWETASVSLPIAAADVKLFNLPDHTILIVGGTDISPLSQVLVLNPELLLSPEKEQQALALVAIDPMPLGLEHSAISLLQDGSLFFSGGSKTSHDQGSAFTGTFTPAKPNWTVPPSSNASRTPASTPSPAPGTPEYRELHSFRSESSFGAPAALLEILDGTFVGTTTSGGSLSRGSLYRVNSDGSGYQVLHDFQGPEGASPFGRIALLHGKIYGITSAGGDHNSGTAYEFDLSTNELHSVLSFENRTRATGLIAAGDQVYGALEGYHEETPYSAIYTYDPESPSQGAQHLQEFTSDECSLPQELTASEGSLFGFCMRGGASGGGIAYRYDLTERNISFPHLFDAVDDGSGAQPVSAPVIIGTSLYGIASNSVTEMYSPGIFRIDLSKKGSYSILWHRNNVQDHSTPIALSPNGTSGVLATLISSGGSDGHGGVLSVNGDGESSLIEFMPSENIAYPVSPVILSQGFWFGTFQSGVHEPHPGTRGGLFRMDPSGSASRILSFIPEAKGSGTVGAPVSLGSKLYGVTKNGGKNGGGTLYSIDPESGATTTLLSFGEESNAGTNPTGGLVAFEGKLYGLTQSCGEGVPGNGCAGSGTLYCFDPERGTLEALVRFREELGLSSPRGSLTLLNQKLYGVVVSGGENGEGAVFEFDLSAQKIFTIASLPADSSKPAGGLATDGQNLFGVMTGGGKSGSGYIYQLKPGVEGGQWSSYDLHDFEGSDTTPGGNLLYHSGSLIGTTMGNGNSLRGTLYKLDLGSGEFRVLHQFLGGRDDLGAPLPGIVQSGNLIYGITYPDWADWAYPDRGQALYRFDTNTLSLQVLHRWAGDRGLKDRTMIGANLTLIGSTLYGTASDQFGVDHFYSIGTGLQFQAVSSALFSSPILTPQGDADVQSPQSEAYSVAEDFKGDGKQGLATTFFNGLLLNFGAPSGGLVNGSILGSKFKSDSSGISSGVLVPGGLPSIALEKPDQNSVEVYLNQGSGTFTEYGNFAMGQKPLNLAISDLRKNGKPDLITVNDSGPGVTILDGGLRDQSDQYHFFAQLYSFDTNENPKGLAISDFNLDGVPDMVIGTRGGGLSKAAITVLTGAATNLSDESPLDYLRADWGIPLRGEILRTGDLTGNGNQSLVISDGSGNLKILLGLANGTFQEGSSYAVDSGTSNFELSDLNGDGNLDLVYVSKSGIFGVMEGRGDGTFREPVTFDSPGANSALAIADFNGDGKPDVAITDGSGNVRTYLNAR